MRMSAKLVGCFCWTFLFSLIDFPGQFSHHVWLALLLSLSQLLEGGKSFQAAKLSVESVVKYLANCENCHFFSSQIANENNEHFKSPRKIIKNWFHRSLLLLFFHKFYEPKFHARVFLSNKTPQIACVLYFRYVLPVVHLLNEFSCSVNILKRNNQNVRKKNKILCTRTLTDKKTEHSFRKWSQTTKLQLAQI